MGQSRGDYIGGQWRRPAGPGAQTIRSINPATAGDLVLEAAVDPAHVGLAVEAAAAAQHEWAAASFEDRVAALRAFARELEPRREALARAITEEMGKTLRESRQEASSLIARVNIVAEQQVPEVKPWSAAGVDGECRHQALGVCAVIGPFNYPLHLLHAHVIPALAAGNSVVIKPSERTPLAAQRYLEAFEAAKLPPVLQMVQGGAEVGRALVGHPGINGLSFTGSWNVGHAIERALSERPDVLVALEMGGQNHAIVLEDADIDQAVEGCLLGAYLSAGQRCTCTSRILVQRTVASTFVDRFVRAARRLTWGDPTTDVFMGPMASVSDRDRVDALVRAGCEAGAEPLLQATHKDGGAWRGPSAHLIAADHDSSYTREEVFGPDVQLTVVDDLDHALSIVNASPYGLSMSVFTARRSQFEAAYRGTRVGCINWNRSTNRASAAFPFGGFGRSGNFRPAGANTIFNSTFPVQVLWNEAGHLEGDPFVRDAMVGADPVGTLEARHRVEEACEPYGLYPEVTDNGEVTIPVSQLATGEVPEPLVPALLAELEQRGVAARVKDDLVRFTLGSGAASSRAAAEHLAGALHAIRHLHPARFLGRRKQGAHVPHQDQLELPRSRAMLDRLVGTDFVPDDKKPSVIDQYRSTGPYLASIDDDPLVILDAASQIASHAGGMNPPMVLEALHTGRFGRHPIEAPAPDRRPAPELSRLKAALRKAAGGVLSHVAFCNSGAESVEVALREAARLRPGKQAIVAFEGSFHGRTMLALHTTWNPAKRERFELEGCQARWSPWPEWTTPHELDPRVTAAELAELWKRGGPRPKGADELDSEELRCLSVVENHLRDDEVVAVIVEPMQSEGGERYATARFFGRLRALTRAWGVPLIVDEVQTGFGLGGPFFWHRRWGLEDGPDFVTSAKKCQVGAVLSRAPLLPLDEPHITSAIRGAIYADIIRSGDPHAYESVARELLADLARKHPETVINPRATGYAFGFDLPDADGANHIVGQRFWRGYMLYGAGPTAVRFRLHPRMTLKAVRSIFERLDASLTDLETGAGTEWRAGQCPDKPGSWPPALAQPPQGYYLVEIDADNWPVLRPAIAALQAQVYEPARRDDMDFMGALIHEPGAICLVALKGKRLPPEGDLVGTCLAFPLEHFAELDGPRQDPMLGRGNTLYSADVTVHPAHRGLGLGTALKTLQVQLAMRAERSPGAPWFEFLTGRNRVGEAAVMRRLNSSFGGHMIATYDGQYGGDGQAIYYRIPLRAPHVPEALASARESAEVLDIENGLTRRLAGRGTRELESQLAQGRMNGEIVNKLSITNFATPGVVRSLEMLRALAPRGLRHLVLASGRSEIVDKGLRSFKFHRPKGRTVIALGPVFAGMSTAAARAISTPGDHSENWFRWPTVDDPTLDPERALTALRKCMAGHPSEELLAVVIEPVYQRTGRAVPASFWTPLAELCKERDVPLVLLENATAGYRSGRGMWRADTLPIKADAVWWYPGGQLGLVFVNDRYYVEKILTLISTWDGDAVSLTRLLWELRVARHLPVGATAERLARILSGLGQVHGEGLYLSVEARHARGLRARLRAGGVHVGLSDEGQLLVAPSLDLDDDDLSRLASSLQAIL